MLLKFTSFAVVGAIGTLLHYLVLYFLVETQGFNPVLASGCGAMVGLLTNYVLNYRITFNSQQSHLQTLPKFAIIALIGLGLNLAIMAQLTQQIYYLYAQIITTLLVLIWNFLANHFWTFNMESSTSKKPQQSFFLFQRVGLDLSLLAVILMIRLITLGFYPLYDPSESRYAEMARKMLELGNWIMPMIDYGVPFWGKPPLTIWLTSLSLAAGGINDFSARLPSFLLGLGMLWLVFVLANRQSGIDKARNASIILASSVLFFVMSGTVAMDQAMSFGLTLALVSFWLALHHDKPFWGYLFFLGLSIGILAKGLLVLVLTGVIIVSWILISRQCSKVWQSIPWISGVLLMLAVSVPWFLIAEQKTPGFLEYFIIGEHWKRFTESGWKGDLYGVGHAHIRGMILLYWLGAAFPWSLLFLNKLFRRFRQPQGDKLIVSDDGWRLYCLLWMLAPLLFFSFSANVIWTYVLPGLPGFALLLAEWLDSGKYRTLLALSVPVGFMVLVMAYQFPEMDFYKSQKVLVKIYQQQATDNERLIYLEARPDSAQFYSQGQALKQSTQQLVQNGVTADFYVIRTNELETLPVPVKTQLQAVKNYSKFTLFHGKPR